MCDCVTRYFDEAINFGHTCHMSKFKIVFLFLFIVSCSHAPKNAACTLSRRGGLDIGSGTTKMLIAKVNSCGPRIEEVVLRQTEKVDIAESLEKSNDNKISEAAANQEEKLILDFAQTVKREDATALGAATAAFRKAANGRGVVNQWSKASGIPIKVISQEQEARLGFEYARSAIGVAPETILVWDIGGGSQQMSYMENGKYRVAFPASASVEFKNFVITKVKRRNANSPNPMSSLEVNRALELAQQFAKSLPSPLVEKLRASQLSVVGIGGVHSKSILGQVKKDDSYTDDDLAIAIDKRRTLTDAELGKYAETQVTNMILVLGFMKELGVHRVRVVDADLTQALVLFPEILTEAGSSEHPLQF